MKTFITILLLAFVGVVGIYLFKFDSFALSSDHNDWGVFGSYFSGMLSPVIAGLAVYLIAETYKLQKSELKELKDTQAEQLKLAALTALLNSGLVQITTFQAEEVQLLNQIDLLNDKETVRRVISLNRVIYLGDPDAEDFEERFQKEEDRNQEFNYLMKELDDDSVEKVYRIWKGKAEIQSLIEQHRELKSKIEKISKK